MRWSRDVLLRIALLGGVWIFYYDPLRFLQDGSSKSSDSSMEQTAQRVASLRLWLSLATTIISMIGVISTQLIIVSCIHASLPMVQHVAGIALYRPSPTPQQWSWQSNSAVSCMYECSCLVSFFLVVRFVLFPPPSTLASLRRHSRQLKRFFQQHDRKYVSLADSLMEDYTGNERLLFARVRKIYRNKMPPTSLTTP